MKLHLNFFNNVSRRNISFLRYFGFLAVFLVMSESGWGQLTEGFETGLPASYNATTSYTLSSGVWTGQANGITSNSTIGVNSGTYSLQIRSQTGAQIITPTLSGGVGTISFYVTASTTSGAYQVNISTDNGVNWSPATGSPYTISTTKTPKSITVNNSNVNKIQIYRTGATIYIDDVVITTVAVSGNTVTFNSNGGTGSMSNQTASTATNLTANSFTRTGYTFASWNTTADGSGTSYADGASYPFAANATLYAQWTINSYNVSYDGNGNNTGTAPTTQSGNYNTSITLSANTGSLAKTGFAFDGWNTAVNGSGTSYATGVSFTIPASNTTLYAKWASTSPAINVSGTLTALTTTYGTPSTNVSFIVSGLNLTDNVVVTAPTGFEVSLIAGSGFAGSLSLTPASGTLANTTIYVRLKANAPASSYTSQVISCVSTLDGVSQNVTIPTSTVSQKALTISGLSGVNKEYDASTAATFSGTPTLVGVVSGDDVTLGGTGSASFATKSIGTNKPVTVSGFSISGTHATNYTVTQPTGLTANITAKALTITGAAAQNKTYDGNTTAVITGATLVGIISPDVVTVSGGGVFGSANVATGISVTSSLTLGGADASNYTLTQPTGLTAEITKANPVITTSTIGVSTGGTYSLPGANISSTSPGTLSYSITGSGTIATLVGTTITGVTVGTETLTVNQAASINYNAGSTTVSVVVSTFNNGDFRSKTDGSWHSTVASSTSTWESFNGTTWVPSSAPGTNLATLGTKTVYILNTITLVGSNTAPNVVVENTGILNTSTVSSTFGNLLVKNGGTFNREGNGSGVSGVFEVEDGGLFTFKHTNTTSRSTTIWAGTEKFHPNSIFKILTVDSSVMLILQSINDVSEFNENGVSACFGNIIIDCSTGKFNLVPSGFNKQLTHKDLIFRNNSDNSPLSTGDLTTTIGGDLKIESTYTGTINFASTASNLNITVKGNFNHNGTKAFRPTTNLGANSTFSIEGNLLLSNGGSFIMNNGTGPLTGTSIVNLKGNLSVSSASIINSTATGNNIFNLNGASIQTIDVSSTIASTNINFTNKSGAYVKIANHDFNLGSNCNLTIENGGILDFNGYNVLGSGSFTASSGSKIIVTDATGINSSGATGNVQTTTRSFSSSGSYEFKGAGTGTFTTTPTANTVNSFTLSNNDEVSLSTNLTTNNLTINSGSTLNIPAANLLTVNNAFTLAGNLVLDKTLTTASQFINSGTLTSSGKVRVKVHFDDYTKWQFVSFPFAIDAVKESSDGTDAEIYPGTGDETNYDFGVVTYNALNRANGATPTWTKVTALPLTAGTGYAMWGRPGNDLYFESSAPASTAFGTTATKDLTYTTGSAASATNYGWNFISHPLTANSFGKLSTGEFLYTYNSTSDSYTTVNEGTGVTTSNAKSFDAYFIKTAVARSNFNFSTASMPASIRSSESKDQLALNLVGSSATYSTEIKIMDESTTAYDQFYDAPYAAGMSTTTPQIYTLVGTERFAINSVPDESIVPVGIRVPSTGNYTLTWDAQLSNVTASLYDIVEDKTTDLTSTGSYSFETAVSGRINDRFFINVGQRVITRLDNDTDNQLIVSGRSGRIIIEGLSGTTSINLFDVTGRLLNSQLVSTATMTIDVPTAGMYLLNLNNKTIKLVVNSK